MKSSRASVQHRILRSEASLLRKSTAECRMDMNRQRCLRHTWPPRYLQLCCNERWEEDRWIAAQDDTQKYLHRHTSEEESSSIKRTRIRERTSSIDGRLPLRRGNLSQRSHSLSIISIDGIRAHLSDSNKLRQSWRTGDCQDKKILQRKIHTKYRVRIYIHLNGIIFHSPCSFKTR